MKKTVVLLGLLLFGLGTKAQEVQKDHFAIFQDFVDESVAYYASDEFISMNNCYDTFYDMINLTKTNPPLGGGETMDLGDWLTENLGLTEFSSAEEGVMMLYRCGQQADAVSYKMRSLFNKLDSIVGELSKEEMYEVFFPILSRFITNEAQDKIEERSEFSTSYLRLNNATAQIKP